MYTKSSIPRVSTGAGGMAWGLELYHTWRGLDFVLTPMLDVSHPPVSPAPKGSNSFFWLPYAPALNAYTEIKGYSMVHA